MAVPRQFATLLLAAVAASGCGPAPAPAQSVTPSADASAAPVAGPSILPFTASAWPAAGSACGTPGYLGSIGRIEAVDAVTVRFVLCAPDGAFLARLAHPSLGIVAAAALDRLAADPAAAAVTAGSGSWRIEATGTDNVQLIRASSAKVGETTTVIIRWQADAATRTADLQSASVDAIDAPAAAELDGLATLPEVTVVPRAGLATAYLAFGRGTPFAAVRVRLAVAQGIDAGALVAAFPAGSTAATHISPCEAASGCAGPAAAAFNAAAGAAGLVSAGFNLTATYPLHVPDAPIPGLPDPAGVAAALAAQLQANLGLNVTIDAMPAAKMNASIAAGTLDGLYLNAVASPVPDASAFLAPLFSASAAATIARRATGVAGVLHTIAANTDPAARDAAFAAIGDTLKATTPLVPLVHLGSETAWRSDVAGSAASPVGADPLGSAAAPDRGQLVFMQAMPANGGWCGTQSSPDAWRLCAMVSDGLYGFSGATTTPEPRLAVSCSPDATAKIWTCRLRAGIRTASGGNLDAGDVLASFRAGWDPAAPLRASASPNDFNTWNGLFGGPLLPAGG